MHRSFYNCIGQPIDVPLQTYPGSSCEAQVPPALSPEASSPKSKQINPSHLLPSLRARSAVSAGWAERGAREFRSRGLDVDVLHELGAGKTSFLTSCPINQPPPLLRRSQPLLLINPSPNLWRWQRSPPPLDRGRRRGKEEGWQGERPRRVRDFADANRKEKNTLPEFVSPGGKKGGLMPADVRPGPRRTWLVRRASPGPARTEGRVGKGGTSSESVLRKIVVRGWTRGWDVRAGRLAGGRDGRASA